MIAIISIIRVLSVQFLFTIYFKTYIQMSSLLNPEHGECQLAKRWQSVLSGHGLLSDSKITEYNSAFLNFSL